MIAKIKLEITHSAKSMKLKNKKRIALFVVIILIAVIFKVLGFDQYLTLSYIKATQESFAALYAQNRIAVIAGYMAIYITVTALSLPGATVLTLAGGGLFGFWAGIIIISFASAIGATLACFTSRFLLREWVQKKFAEKLSAVNRGIEKEGAFYLFTLRLIPIFPFFVINLVMGVTNMPLMTYYFVSQIGMLPGTAVYVNAGKELAKIQSLSGLLSPTLLASFALLGIFPLALKKIMGMYASSKLENSNK